MYNNVLKHIGLTLARVSSSSVYEYNKNKLKFVLSD